MGLGEKVVWGDSEKRTPIERGSGGCTESGDGDEDREEKKAAPASFNCLFASVTFGSVTQSCLILCDPMDCSTPGFPVHHQLLKLPQTHVH